ncbi:MAG: outer membrane beta-barrel protein [Gemmatimonas sp.]
MNRVYLCALLSSVVPTAIRAQSVAGDTTTKITWGAFVDTYYAWDFQRPISNDRSFAGGALFTTQPARHNEFNVNLAFVEAKLDGQRVRGRIALQAGTSVQSNYSGEPANGQVSGPSLARYIQEAVVGAKLADNVWIDGGIFFSHMGMESWASRDNPTYTRSLVAEYSPYYQSGARITWTASPKLTAQVDVVNGWQNISENNRGKGAGIRLDFTPVTNTTLSYYNFFTQEAGTRLRTFNGVGTKVVKGRATLLGQVDVGTQDKSDAANGTASWYGFTGIARAQLSSNVAMSVRLERFDDKNQVIIGTGSVNDVTNAAFRGNGVSVGLDWSPQSRFMWRTELRGFQNDKPVFPDGIRATLSKRDALVVTSLTLTF